MAEEVVLSELKEGYRVFDGTCDMCLYQFEKLCRTGEKEIDIEENDDSVKKFTT